MSIDTIPIRRGEELNTIELSAYLTEHFDLSSGDLRIEQFASGASNLTYLLTIDGRDLVLRRPPFGNTVKTAHDMRREFDVLSKLSMVYSPAPKPLMFCGDESVIGSEFYLMERRHGLILRGEVPQIVEDSLTTQRSVCDSFIANLASLHDVDHRDAGLAELGKPDGYVRRQIEGWSKRYFAAKTDEHSELEHAIRWLQNDMPGESGIAIVHNDYKFDNVMLDPNDLSSINTVLDWEMVTVGDPLMDLGTTLGYWMSKDAGVEMMKMPFNPRVLMENVSRTDLAAMYAEHSGRDISHILFYYVFGTVKIAVIAQQIFARFKKGLTLDGRFAHFDIFVKTLGRIALRAIDAKQI